MVHQAKYNRYELERIAEEQADEIGRLREENDSLRAELERDLEWFGNLADALGPELWAKVKLAAAIAKAKGE